MALLLTILFGFILGAFATFVACRRVIRSNYVKRVDFDSAVADAVVAAMRSGVDSVD